MIDLKKATVLSDFSVYRINASGNSNSSYNNPIWATTHHFIFIYDSGSNLYNKYIIVGPNTFISLHSSGMSATIKVRLKYFDKDYTVSMNSNDWTHIDCGGGANKLYYVASNRSLYTIFDIGDNALGLDTGNVRTLTEA